MNKKSNIAWMKPAEPAFLRKFKSDVGFTEGPTVDTKRELPKLDGDSDDSDREDEKPQVVVLKKGHLTAEEAQKIKDEIKDSKPVEEKASADGKIIFKKPEKRSSEKFQGITASSNKKRKQQEKDIHKGKEENEGKKVINSSLLSFGDDEEEHED